VIAFVSDATAAPGTTIPWQDGAMSQARRAFPCLTSLLAAWLLTATAAAQDVPPSTVENGAFAFANEAGTHLLVTSDVVAENLRTAFCAGAGPTTVVFERRQSGRPDRPRQTPQYFDDLTGTVFRLAAGRLDGGETCFLATDVFLSGTTVIPVRQGEDEACAVAVRRQLESSRSRSIVNCWTIGVLDKNRRIVLVEFERRGKDALASVVLLDNGRSIFADLAAEYRGEGQELWRAGDDGVLSPVGFHVVCVLQRGTFRALAISWSGEEGESVSLFVADTGNEFRAVIGDYWYRAPR
jgi:hypothetical protein